MRYGKSVLAKSLIDNDFKTLAPTVSTCYFFFKDNEEQNSLSIALCVIIHQLFSQQPNFIRHAIPLWKQNGENLQHEVDELWRVLFAAADSAAHKTFCVFDAHHDKIVRILQGENAVAQSPSDHFALMASPSGSKEVSPFKH